MQDASEVETPTQSACSSELGVLVPHLSDFSIPPHPLARYYNHRTPLMFNNFQIDSIDHGISMSDNPQFEQHHLHGQQHQFSQQPDQQPSMGSLNPPSASSSTTPASSAASNAQDVNDTTGPSSSTGPVPVTPKPAYGSGEPDDGYTLVFSNLDEFQAWRAREEEGKIVEFVKGDTHGSKAIPPRFKDHTKLVCARHTRSGRKKYVKKFPERQRKLPSRKIEGEGCPASISYKTFYHTDQVRACYNDKHSHEIGEANLLFTRRGRKAAQEKGKLGAFRANAMLNGNTSPSLQNGSGARQNAIAGPSSIPHDPNISPALQHPHLTGLPPSHGSMTTHGAIPSAISLLAPLPPPPSNAPQAPDAAQERWDRMGVLFGSIRQHARGFDYPGPSVAALESVLIRLYLESPLGGGLGPGTLSGPGMNGMGEGGPGS